MKKKTFFNVCKFTVFLFLVFFFGVQDSHIAYGADSGCTSAGPYSTTTGQLCSTGTASGCISGYLFSPLTGAPCGGTSPTIPPTPTSGGSLKYVKTLLNILNTYQYPQSITDAIVANNQFILGGKGCLMNMTNNGRGGGIWIVSEDGSKISERNSCLDAGMPSKLLGNSFHGQTVTGNLHVNWGGDGFIKENYSIYTEANHAVFYSGTGVPISSSPLGLYNNYLKVLKNRVLATVEGTDQKLLSLPDWNVIGAGSFNGNIETATIGNFLVSNGTLFSVGDGGDIKEVKKLSSGTIQSGYSFHYTLDNSTSPAKLAILEAPKPPTYLFNPGDGKYTAKYDNNRKIYVYKLFGTEVVLDKTINPSTDMIGGVTSIRNSFGVWGDYIVSRNSNGGEIELWKGDLKIDTVKIPGVSFATPYNIVISKGGYVAVTIFGNDEGKNAAYLFKIDGSGSSTSPVDSGCSTGSVLSTTTGNPCVCVLNPKFPMGTRSEEVRAFQQKLKDAGFYSGNVDGIYGPITRAADLAYCISVEHPIYTPPASAGSPPVISVINGPTSLGVNTLGTWTASATDANKDDLSWSVNFGEGKSVLTCKVNPPVGTSQGWIYSASHSWAQAGTYTVTFYVNDCKGGSTSKSVTVKVSGTGGGGSSDPLNQNPY